MKIGDKVRFLSEIGGGRVAGFQGKNVVLVEDEDGFQVPMAINEVVVIGDENYDTSRVVEIKQQQAKAKETVKLTEKAVSLEEFNKLFEKENKESKSKKK